MKRREMIIVALLVVSLATVSLYGTFATDVTMNNKIATDSDLAYTFDISDQTGRTVTVNAGVTKIVDLFLTNKNSGTIKYGVGYTTESTITDDVIIGVANTSKDKITDNIAKDSTKQITIVVENKSTSAITINLVPLSGYENGGDLILSSGITQITKEYDLEIKRTSYEMIEHLGLTSLVKTGTPDFSAVATTDEGIYTAEDDLGTSYYFRGASERNYVYFAGFYWRIVRINGDGTIRLVYDGTTKHKNGESSEDRQIEVSPYYVNYDDNAYFGYMYGTPGSSTYEATHENVNPSVIKTVVDTWYGSDIDETAYEQYIADAIYCNDRQVGSSGNGIGRTFTYYTAHDRLNASKPTPTLKCEQVNDRFTQSASLGNGALTYPVGLLTADEIAFAGGADYVNTLSNYQYYLYTGQYYLTMTPSFFENGPDMADIYAVYIDGKLGAIAGGSNGVRPVISLKSTTVFEGDGSYETPFEISTV